MNISEEDFIKKLRETFYAEAEEHISRINTGLIDIEKSGVEGKEELIDTIFREAHNLKGGARAVNHDLLQSICQSLESVLSSLRQGTITLTSESFDTLYATLEVIRKFLKVEDDLDDDEALYVEKNIDTLEAIAKGEEYTQNERVSKPKKGADSSEVSKVKKAEEKKEKAEDDKESKRSKPVKKRQKEEKSDDLPLYDSTVRVSTRKLDKLLRQIEEILVIKLTSRQRVHDLNSILKELDFWRKERKRVQKDLQEIYQWLSMHTQERSSAIPQHSIQLLYELFGWEEDKFKEVYEGIKQIAKQTDKDSRISGNIVDNLLDDTKAVLMQPFNTMLQVFPMMVRDIAKQLEKKVSFEIIGDHIEIDKRILEELKDPITHIIRNSIDHGIESPERRKELGKAEEGSITISISEAGGSNVNISLSDDGRGIDIENLKENAIEKKVVTRSDAEKMNDDEAAKLIFYSGVTTSKIITDLSGRGLGAGIVSEKVEKLGGKLSIETKKDEGTTFHIEIPITMATFRGVYIAVSGQDFIIPTHYLVRVLRKGAFKLSTIEGTRVLCYEGGYLPYIHLRDILGIQNDDDEMQENAFVIVMQARGVMIALGVDAILKEQEVFIKGMGGQFSNIQNIATATVMEWGKVIPILDPADIIESCLSGAKSVTMQKPKVVKEKVEKKTILIAEDTVTARMLLKNILDAAGYQVKTAVDGAEAFTILSQQKVDLLLSDVEMPRLDGFALTEKVRANEKLKELPIVLCTSRSKREDQEKGVAVGANAYIIKSSFEQSNLLETIEKLI